LASGGWRDAIAHLVETIVIEGKSYRGQSHADI